MTEIESIRISAVQIAMEMGHDAGNPIGMLRMLHAAVLVEHYLTTGEVPEVPEGEDEGHTGDSII